MFTQIVDDNFLITSTGKSTIIASVEADVIDFLEQFKIAAQKNKKKFAIDDSWKTYVSSLFTQSTIWEKLITEIAKFCTSFANDARSKVVKRNFQKRSSFYEYLEKSILQKINNLKDFKQQLAVISPNLFPKFELPLNEYEFDRDLYDVLVYTNKNFSNAIEKILIESKEETGAPIEEEQGKSEVPEKVQAPEQMKAAIPVDVFTIYVGKKLDKIKPALDYILSHGGIDPKKGLYRNLNNLTDDFAKNNIQNDIISTKIDISNLNLKSASGAPFVAFLFDVDSVTDVATYSNLIKAFESSIAKNGKLIFLLVRHASATVKNTGSVSFESPAKPKASAQFEAQTYLWQTKDDNLTNGIETSLQQMLTILQNKY